MAQTAYQKKNPVSQALDNMIKTLMAPNPSVSEQQKKLLADRWAEIQGQPIPNAPAAGVQVATLANAGEGVINNSAQRDQAQLGNASQEIGNLTLRLTGGTSADLKELEGRLQKELTETQQSVPKQALGMTYDLAKLTNRDVFGTTGEGILPMALRSQSEMYNRAMDLSQQQMQHDNSLGGFMKQLAGSMAPLLGYVALKNLT